MRQIWQAALLITICITAQVEAQDVRRLYTQAELESIGSRYRPNLKGLWEEDFLSRLTPDERLRAGTVALSLPLLGANRSPLDFYADSGRRQVFLPIASVKFMDDLAVAFAYYEKMGCAQGTVSDYTAALRFRPQDAKGSPLDALGVPAAAINDPFVDDVAQKILKSTVFFVAAHEYAHVMYRHKGYRAMTAEEAQRQEVEADAFALDVLRRIGVAPLGVVYFFLIASRLEASPGDFPTPDEYETYLRQRATHPVSARRILKVAEAIEGNVGAFSRLQSDPAATERTLRALVPQLKQIGRTLDDRATRRGLAERAQAADMAAFRRGCRG
jgi:hypothetical protein